MFLIYLVGFLFGDCEKGIDGGRRIKDNTVWLLGYLCWLSNTLTNTHTYSHTYFLTYLFNHIQSNAWDRNPGVLAPHGGAEWMFKGCRNN